MNLIGSLNVDCSNMGAWDVYVSLVFPLCVKNKKFKGYSQQKLHLVSLVKSELVHWISTQSCAWIQLRYSYFQLLLSRKMSSGQNTMRTPTLQPVPESLPADHVSNSNKKKVGTILLMKTQINIYISIETKCCAIFN